MTFYRYKAVGKEGFLQKGILEAHSSADLRRQLREFGFSLISYSLDISFFLSRKVKPQALMDLCLHLEQFENAGIPLKESLEELTQIQTVPKLKTALIEVVKNIERGFLLSHACARHPKIFDSVFVSLITTGEKTGHLSSGFHQILQHLKWMDEVHSQTFKALRYPLTMSIVLLAVISILMTVLVPELVKFIQSSSIPIPLSTRLLVSFSRFFSDYIFLILPTFGITNLLLMAFFKHHPKGSLWKDRFLDGLPLIGTLRRMISLSRFSHIFAVMFGNGIDVLQSLQTARQSLNAGYMHLAFGRVESFVKEGLSLSEAFQKSAAFPSIIVRMIKIGEQTSSLQKTLFYVKEHVDTTLKRKVDHIVALIEPVMILSVGLVMVWIIYSIFLPLYDSLSYLDY